jgi:hypothetical protein
MTSVSTDELVGNDRRMFSRIVPSVEEPILLRTKAGLFPLIEISGGGCRLPVAAHTVILESAEQQLSLPGRSCSIPVNLRPVAVHQKSIGVEFVGLAGELREQICDYVRTRELELVRRFCTRKTATAS